jgi:hypothetical protein
MMKVIGKENNDLILLALKEDEIEKGDYLIVDDNRKALLIQMYDESYLNTESVVDDMIKDEIIKLSSMENRIDPLNVSDISKIIRDARLIRCKIRGAVINGIFYPSISYLPSRVDSTVKRLTISELNNLLKRDGMLPIVIGNAKDELLTIYAEDLDGRLNIITGKKESGKSHLAKILVKRLVEHGAYVIILDLNNEYIGLGWNKNGKASSINDKVLVLESGKDLRFTLDYIGKAAVSSMLRYALDMPAASMREFSRIWDSLSNASNLTLASLSKAITTWNVNELIRDAMLSRLHTIIASRLFTDDQAKSIRFEEIVRGKSEGAAIVIGMGKISPIARRMTVEIILSKLVELLEGNKIPPIFLFAEEAHLYLRDTYWEDIVTRMRHFGIFTTFVTNQPDAIDECIYRQVDNIFLFNFTSDADLERISKISLADSDTIKSIVRTLPQRHCFVIGRVVNDLPIVIKSASAQTLTFGETKKFFKMKAKARI